MKKRLKTTWALLFVAMASMAQNVEMTGPDGRLRLRVVDEGETGVSYSVTYDGKQMVNASPLGMKTNVGDFSSGLKLVKHETSQIDTTYQLTRIKTSQVHYQANELVCHLSNAEGNRCRSLSVSVTTMWLSVILCPDRAKLVACG